MSREDRIRQKELRVRMRQKFHVAKANALTLDGSTRDAYIKRQRMDLEEIDVEVYDANNLIVPIYSFSQLYVIFEESDMLQQCVDAMVQNVDGFGYMLQFTGDDQKEKDRDEYVRQRIKAESFFDHANEDQSWMTIRKKMRKDYEVLGNGAFEILRNKKGEIGVIYHLPFKWMRASKILADDLPVIIKLPVKRGGKYINIPVQKYFRKFAQVAGTDRVVRWFKEFGDPRIMDAQTGEFVTDENGKLLSDKQMPTLQASEVIHFKNDFDGSAYGLPRWIGSVLDVRGRRLAQFVNYDLFNSQGIPPMAVMVSGGTLTDESVEELEGIINSIRGAENWNRIFLLESNPESLGLEDKGTAKIELKPLAEYRKEDQMFTRYIEKTEETIRHSYRLAPLYVGSAESFTHATARSSRLVAEEQVFVPERQDFDERINSSIVFRELGIEKWKYKTKGPKIVGADELSKGVEAFSKVGAFTINHAIQMANEAFNISMSQFKESWGNYPILIVLELIKSGRLSELDAIVEKTGIQLPPKEGTAIVVPAQAGAEKNVQKMESINLDNFTEDEVNLYKSLLEIQRAVLNVKGS